MEIKGRLKNDIVLYLVFFGTARVLAPFWFGPRYSEFASFHYPFAALSDHGFYPFVHYWLEYPPLFPYLSVGIFQFVSLIFGAGEALHFQAYGVCLQILMGLVDVANAALIYVLVSRRTDTVRAAFAAILFCLSFSVSFVASGFYDGLTLFFILLSLASFTRGRARLAGVALGLGVCTKILPLVLLPAFVKFRRDSRELAHVVISLAVTVALLWGTFFLVSSDLAAMPLRANAVRQPWETVWALLEGQFQFGALVPDTSGEAPLPEVPEAAARAVGNLRIDAAGMDPSLFRIRVLSRFSTDLSAFPHAAQPLVYLIAGLAFAGIFLITWRGVPPDDRERVVPYAGFLLMLLLLYSKGWSPQFVILPSAFILLCHPGHRGAWLVLALMLINFLEMPIWLSYLRNIEGVGPAVLVVLVLARTILISGLAVRWWRGIRG